MNNFKKLKMFIKLSWEISPAYIFILLANTLISSTRLFLNIILPKYLIDELVLLSNYSNIPSVKSFIPSVVNFEYLLENNALNKLLLFGAIIILSNLLFAFLENTMKRILDVKSIYVREKMNQAMSRKIMSLDFSYLEDPYYLDLKERSIFALNIMRVLQTLIDNIAKALNNIVTIIGLIVILFTLSWVLVVFSLAAVVLQNFAYKSFIEHQKSMNDRLIPTNRRLGYYINLTGSETIQKDIRLFNMNKMLIDKISAYNKEIYYGGIEFYRKKGKFEGMTGIINDLQAAISYGYVGLRVISDNFGAKIGLGSFTMYVSAAINFTRTTVALGRSITVIMQMLGYLDPFMEFMSLPNENIEGKTKFSGEVESIKFENVSFKYPKSDKFVLEDISFEINKNEKISIVGLNGAGKTTLVKLICRLYHPTNGKIYINGHDIFEYDYDSYMNSIATVFQDFKIFAFSIDENISCNFQNSNTERVMELIKDVGLDEKIKILPKGVASMFGKAYDEDGIDMSGGEKQKIAIARALYKNASLIILDEPTSALDPLAEAEIYENFNNLVGDKTAIYISHRMSSSVFCDKILIIDEGKVKDFDTHKNLMKKTESLYYKLFNSQAVNYSE